MRSIEAVSAFGWLAATAAFCGAAQAQEATVARRAVVHEFSAFRLAADQTARIGVRIGREAAEVDLEICFFMQQGARARVCRVVTIAGGAASSFALDQPPGDPDVGDQPPGDPEHPPVLTARVRVLFDELVTPVPSLVSALEVQEKGTGRRLLLQQGVPGQFDPQPDPPGASRPR